MDGKVGRYAAAAVVAVTLMVSFGIACASALACGYHNPSDVARGIMNFAYPKSLYVRTAVWQARAGGILPPRPTKPAKDLFAYQRAVADLQRLGARLATPESGAGAFVVVLLDSMLWTRFVPDPDGFSVAVHAKGPEPGDAVFVTEVDVIKALLDDGLGLKAAEAYGLVRLYGPADRQAQARAALTTVPSNGSAPASK